MRPLEGTLAATWMLLVAVLLTENPAAAQSGEPPGGSGREGDATGSTTSPRPDTTASEGPSAADLSPEHAGQPDTNARPAPPPVAPRPYASGLTMPMSCGSPLCARWAPPQVPYGRGLRPARPASPYRPFVPPVGFERPPPPETPTHAKGFDFGRLTLEGLGGFGGFLVGSLIGYPLIIAGLFGGAGALVYSGLVVLELGWAAGLHMVGQLLDVDGSFAVALAGTLLGGLVGGLLGALASKAEDSSMAATLSLVGFGAFLYIPAVVYEWGAGVYDD